MGRRFAILAFGLALGLAAPQAALAWTLTIATNGAGSGTIDGAGFACEWDGTSQNGSDCTEVYAGPTTVGLTAVGAGSVPSWTGCDVTVGAYCAVENVSADRTITVTFKRAYVLTVTRAGTGSGTVTSSPAGVSCGSDCVESYADGTAVTLTAVAAAGSAFTGWSGACTGTGTCSLTMSASRAVTATFDVVVPSYGLTVETEGSGTVTSSPAGIACGSDCFESYPSGTTVALAATAVTGFRFVRWESCPSPSGALCTVVLTAARSVTAVFVDDAVDADVLGASTHRTASGKRVLQAEIRTDEVIRVRLQLIRNGRVILSKTIATFRPGQTTVRLTIPAGVAGGRATAKVILTDRHGNTDTFRQPVRVPSPA